MKKVLFSGGYAGILWIWTGTVREEMKAKPALRCSVVESSCVPWCSDVV